MTISNLIICRFLLFQVIWKISNILWYIYKSNSIDFHIRILRSLRGRKMVATVRSNTMARSVRWMISQPISTLHVFLKREYEIINKCYRAMHTLALYIPGNDENIRIIRRTLMRYLNLTLVLILRSISSAVKKRFPTLDHLTEVGVYV